MPLNIKKFELEQYLKKCEVENYDSEIKKFFSGEGVLDIVALSREGRELLEKDIDKYNEMDKWYLKNLEDMDSKSQKESSSGVVGNTKKVIGLGLIRLDDCWRKEKLGKLGDRTFWNELEIKLKNSKPKDLKEKFEKLKGLQQQCMEQEQYARYSPDFLIVAWDHLNRIDEALFLATKKELEKILSKQELIKTNVFLSEFPKLIPLLRDALRELSKNKEFNTTSWLQKNNATFNNCLRLFNGNLEKMDKEDIKPKEKFLLIYLKYLLHSKAEVLVEKTKLAFSMMARLTVASNNGQLNDGDLIRYYIKELKTTGLINVKGLEMLEKNNLHIMSEQTFNEFHERIFSLESPELISCFKKLRWWFSSTEVGDFHVKPQKFFVSEKGHLYLSYSGLKTHLKQKVDALSGSATSYLGISIFELATYNLKVRKLIDLAASLKRLKFSSEDILMKIKENSNAFAFVSQIIVRLLRFLDSKPEHSKEIILDLRKIYVVHGNAFFSNIFNVFNVLNSCKECLTFNPAALGILYDAVDRFFPYVNDFKDSKEFSEIKKIFDSYINNFYLEVVDILREVKKPKPDLNEITLQRALAGIVACTPPSARKPLCVLKAFLSRDEKSKDYPKDYASLEEVAGLLKLYVKGEPIHLFAEFLAKTVTGKDSFGFRLMHEVDKKLDCRYVKAWKLSNEDLRTNSYDDLHQAMTTKETVPYKNIANSLLYFQQIGELEDILTKGPTGLSNGYLADYTGSDNSRAICFIPFSFEGFNLNYSPDYISNYSKKYVLKRCAYLLMKKDVSNLYKESEKYGKIFELPGVRNEFSKIAREYFFEEKEAINNLAQSKEMIELLGILQSILVDEDKEIIRKKYDFNFVFGKKWEPEMQYLITSFGTDSQKLEYKLTWLRSFLGNEVSDDSIFLSHQLEKTFAVRVIDSYQDHLESAKMKLDIVDVKEFYHNRLERAMKMIEENLRDNILNEKVQYLLSKYFNQFEIVGESQKLYQSAQTFYTSVLKIHKDIEELFQFLDDNKIKVACGRLSLYMQNLQEPALVNVSGYNKLYQLYWDKKLLPALENWPKKLLGIDGNNQSDKDIFEMVISFDKEVAKYLSDTDARKNLSFIVENIEIIRDLNKSFVNDLTRYSLTEWYLVLNEKAKKLPGNELQKKIEIILNCILAGFSDDKKYILLDKLARLSVDRMSDVSVKSFIVFKKLIEYSLEPKKNHQIFEALKLELIQLISMHSPDAQETKEVKEKKEAEAVKKTLSDWLKVVFRKALPGVDLSEPGFVQSRVLETRKISEDFQKALLSPAEDELPSGQTHKVVAVNLSDYEGPKLYFKFLPDAPGDEFSVRSLYRLLFEPDMPHVELLKFSPQTKGDRAYPVLASEDTVGKRLDECWRDKEPITLDPEFFSRTVLMNIITNPLDLKPENIMVQKVESDPGQKNRYRLRSFDNDQSFMKPIYDGEGADKNRKHLGVKTAIFCFDDMRKPLHSTVVKEVLELNIHSCLLKWVTDITLFNENYTKYFSAEEYEYWASLPDKKAVVLLAQLEPELVTELYRKISLIKETLEKQPEIPAIELLNIIIPEISSYYREALQNEELSPSQRFKIIVDKEYHLVESQCKQFSYYGTSTSINIISRARYGRLPNRKKEYLEMVDIKPKRLENLDDLHKDYENIKKIVDDLRESNKVEYFYALKHGWMKERVFSGINVCALGEKQQLLILNLMIGNPVKQLDLSKCQFLTIELLMKIVQSSPALKRLKINDCKNLIILPEHLVALAGHCKELESLEMQGNMNIKNFYYPWGWLKLVYPITFNHLIHLDVSGCSSLRELRISAPQLRSFHAKGCEQLIVAEIKAAELQQLNFSGCGQLKMTLSSSLNLKKVFLNETPLIHGWFYEKYPQLLTVPLEEMNTKFVLTLDKGIEKTFAQLRIEHQLMPHNVVIKLSHMLQKYLEYYSRKIRKLTFCPLIAFYDDGSYVSDPISYGKDAITGLLLGGLVNKSSHVEERTVECIINLIDSSIFPSKYLQPTINPLLGLIKDGRHDVKVLAVRCLIKLSADVKIAMYSKSMIDILLELLKDNVALNRINATQLLNGLLMKSDVHLQYFPSIVNTLSELLKDENCYVRAGAVECLIKLLDTEDFKPVVDTLLELLNNKDPFVRIRAVNELVHLLNDVKINSEYFKPVVETLCALLNNQSLLMLNQFSGMGALAVAKELFSLIKYSKINFEYLKTTEDTLFGLLTNRQDRDVKMCAIESLVELLSNAKINPEYFKLVLDRLLKLLNDKEAYVKENVSECLIMLLDSSKIDSVHLKSVVDALLTLLNDTSYHTRVRSVTKLFKLFSNSKINLEHLKQAKETFLILLKHESFFVKKEMVNDFIKLVGKSEIYSEYLEKIIDTLLGMLSDNKMVYHFKFDVADHLVELIGDSKTSPESEKKIVGALLGLLNHEDKSESIMRSGIINHLIDRIDSTKINSEYAKETLLGLLREEDSNVKLYAARVLIKLLDNPTTDVVMLKTVISTLFVLSVDKYTRKTAVKELLKIIVQFEMNPERYKIFADALKAMLVRKDDWVAALRKKIKPDDVSLSPEIGVDIFEIFVQQLLEDYYTDHNIYVMELLSECMQPENFVNSFVWWLKNNFTKPKILDSGLPQGTKNVGNSSSEASKPKLGTSFSGLEPTSENNEPETKKKKDVDSLISRKDLISLADGNCAFNAVALGVCDLIDKDQIKNPDVYKFLFGELEEVIPKTREGFLVWYKKTNADTLQKKLSPVLRKLSVNYIRHHYDYFGDCYEEPLVSAFNKFIENGSIDIQNDDTYGVHEHIKKKFEELRNKVQSKKEAKKLAEWWRNEGKDEYFDILSLPASGAGDRARWGSDTEIGVLGFLLKLKIRFIKNRIPRLLGVGCGFRSDLSEAEMAQLQAHNIGAKYNGGFIFEKAGAELKEILDKPFLSEQEIKYVNENRKLIEDCNQHLGKRNAEDLKIKTLCEKLKVLGAFTGGGFELASDADLTKALKSNKELLEYSLKHRSDIRKHIINDGEFYNKSNTKLEKNCSQLYTLKLIGKKQPKLLNTDAGLANRIKPISKTLIDKINACCKVQAPTFEIEHENNHWSYNGVKDAHLNKGSTTWSYDSKTDDEGCQRQIDSPLGRKKTIMT